MFVCLLRCCFGLRFQMATVGLLATLSTLWCDAYCLFGSGDHSALHFLEMVQIVFCVEKWVPGSSSQGDEADLFEWVEVESYEPEPLCTMTNNTPHTFDLVGEARRRGWCEHELMFHIFEFGVPEGLHSMEAHMKALASAEEGSESVLQGRRMLELAAEEDEANSVIFPWGVLQEDKSVNESSSSSWQWPWVDMGRVALTCHISLDVLCSEMHQPHDFLPQVLCLDTLIPVNEVRKPCRIPEPVKSVQILFRGGHGLGVWDLEAHMTLSQWFCGGKRGGDLDGHFSTIGGHILNSEVEVCNLGLEHLSEVVFHGRLLGGSFAGMSQGGCVPGTGVWSVDVFELWQN